MEKRKVKQERSILDETFSYMVKKYGNNLMGWVMLYRIQRFLCICGLWSGFGKN